MFSDDPTRLTASIAGDSTSEDHHKPRRKYNNYVISASLIAFAVVGVIIFGLSNERARDYVATHSNESELRRAAETVQKLAEQSDWRTLYDTLLLPNDRKQIPFEEFVRNSEPDGYVLQGWQVTDVKVDGYDGVVTVITTRCYTQACEPEDRKTVRRRRAYSYVNGKWYFPAQNIVYCTRKTPFVIPAEFVRAISLIQQRYEESGIQELIDRSKEVGQMRNCLDIQYAKSDSELEGAEGVFVLDPSAQDDDLRVFVSPRYQAKDDLLTASLLSHELDHAETRASGADTIFSCYENEAWAFYAQMTFLDALAPDEELSIMARAQSGLSEESRQLAQISLAIRSSAGTDNYEKALAYVKTQPFYQTECDTN